MMILKAFTQVDIDGEVVGDDNQDSNGRKSYDNDHGVLSGYYHPWMTNFMETTGPKEVPDSISVNYFVSLSTMK